MTKYTEYAKNPTNFIMLEKGDCRYEYSTTPVKRSNVDDTIIGYRPCIKVCRKLTFGSTAHFDHVSVEQGNKHYLEALAKGFVKVTERSWL